MYWNILDVHLRYQIGINDKLKLLISINLYDLDVFIGISKLSSSLYPDFRSIVHTLYDRDPCQCQRFRTWYPLPITKWIKRKFNCQKRQVILNPLMWRTGGQFMLLQRYPLLDQCSLACTFLPCGRTCRWWVMKWLFHNWDINHYLQLDPTTTEMFFGIMITVYSVGKIVVSPLIGWWSNKTRQVKSQLYMGLCFQLLGNVLYLCAQLFSSNEKYFMLVARFLTGLGAGRIARKYRI